MEIKLIKNSHISNGKYLTGDYVLETVTGDSEYSNIKELHLYVYNVVRNEKHEISPKLPKYDIGGIYNVSISKENVYFLTGSPGEEASFEFCLVKYNVTTDKAEPMYSFSALIEEFEYKYRLKLFILNDVYVLLQKEEYVRNMTDTYGGYFRYYHKLYNSIEDEVYEVVDENLGRNGIESIYAVSDTLAVMKNGFSLLQDNRYNLLEKEEVSVESISYINIGQFISDIMIGQSNINTDVIEQAYFTRTIPYVTVIDDGVLYSAVNFETKEEEVVFYSHTTKEKKNFINQNVVRTSDLAKIHIINKIPYLQINDKHKISFINLRSTKKEFEFDNNLVLNEIINNVIVLSGTCKKGLFRKTTVPFFEIYSFVPKKHLLLREKGEYLSGVSTENDDIYIFKK